MTTHLVTFSDESMSRSRELCMASAAQHGINGRVSFADYSQNIRAPKSLPEALLSQPRGCGLWAWKPLIVGWELKHREIHDGDVLIYADAGIEFINNVNYIIDRMDQDIFLFGNNWEHAHWCKADTVKAIMPSLWSKHAAPEADSRMALSVFGKQCQASVIFFRVSEYTRQFVKEWLDWCLFEGGRLIDDSPSRSPNHPEFREHRHDQAILTTMAYREGIKLHYWPATYNDGAFNYEKLPEYVSDDYPILFHHHRRRDHEWVAADMDNLVRSLGRFNDAMTKASLA